MAGINPVTTPTVQTAALTPDAQTAINNALNKLANFNQIPLAEPGEFVNLTTYFGSSQLNEWKAPYANEIRALADKQPPLSAQEIQSESDRIITRFECKVTFMREMRFMMFQQMMESMQSLLDEVLDWSPV